MAKPFDINKLAQKAKKDAALRRTVSSSKENRVKVGTKGDSKRSSGFQGVAGKRGSIAERLAGRMGPIELGFDDRARTDSPQEGAVSGGEPLEFTRTENRPRYKLQGRKLDVGDTIEVYTNAQTGWLRGRFEWSGVGKERPQLALNLWNPNGPYEDGRAPWLGDLMAPIPESALCRWTDDT